MNTTITNLAYRLACLLVARVRPSVLPALYRRWGRALARPVPRLALTPQSFADVQSNDTGLVIAAPLTIRFWRNGDTSTTYAARYSDGLHQGLPCYIDDAGRCYELRGATRLEEVRR